MPASKREYQLLAMQFAAAREAALYDSPAYSQARVKTVDDLAQRVAAVFALSNSRFKRSAFIAACKIERCEVCGSIATNKNGELMHTEEECFK